MYMWVHVTSLKTDDRTGHLLIEHVPELLPRNDLADWVIATGLYLICAHRRHFSMQEQSIEISFLFFSSAAFGRTAAIYVWQIPWAVRASRKSEMPTVPLCECPSASFVTLDKTLCHAHGLLSKCNLFPVNVVRVSWSWQGSVYRGLRPWPGLIDISPRRSWKNIPNFVAQATLPFGGSS